MEAHLKIDSKAIEALFRTHYDELNRYAYSIIKDPESAEDIVQKLFIKLWEKRNELTITSNARAYLYQATYRAALNELEKLKRQGMHTPLNNVIAIGSTNETGETLSSKELEQQIETAIRSLPEKCEQVFRLSRTKEMSYKEISETLDISVKTVENHMGKALKLMRKALIDYLPVLLITLYC